MKKKKIISHKDYSKHMHFGLLDILDRIKEINKEINKNIFRGFINLSNNYIKQTLTNNISYKNSTLPDLEGVEKLLKNHLMTMRKLLFYSKRHMIMSLY